MGKQNLNIKCNKYHFHN